MVADPPPEKETGACCWSKIFRSFVVSQTLTAWACNKLMQAASSYGRKRNFTLASYLQIWAFRSLILSSSCAPGV